MCVCVFVWYVAKEFGKQKPKTTIGQIVAIFIWKCRYNEELLYNTRTEITKNK